MDHFPQHIRALHTAPAMPGTKFGAISATSARYWFADCSWDGSVCMMTTQNNGGATTQYPSFLMGSYDYGYSYTTLLSFPASMGIQLRQVSISADGSWAVLTADSQLYRSSNRGLNWTAIPGTRLPTPAPPEWRSITCGKASPYWIACK